MNYLDLTETEQAAALRPVAEAAVARFSLPPGTLQLVTHSYNTTFRHDTARGPTHAVRVNTNSLSTSANIRAQQAWIHRLAGAGFVVPDPVLTPEGEPFVTVPCPPLGRDVQVVVNTWLAGEDVGVPMRAGIAGEVATELGASMARMHALARDWTPPPASALPVFDAPLFGDPDRLTGHTLGAVIGGTSGGFPDRSSGVGGPERPNDPPGGLAGVVAESLRRTSATFDRLYAGRTPIVLHANLHGGNLKWYDGRLAIFDFDDAGLGVPELDLAIAVLYLREPDGTAERALLAGYRSVAELPERYAEVTDDLQAARQLLLANALLTSTTASWQAEADDYVRTTGRRLAHWLDTGRFTRQPD